MSNIGIYYSPANHHYVLADIQRNEAYFVTLFHLFDLHNTDYIHFWPLKSLINDGNDYEFLCCQDDLSTDYPELFI